MNSSPSLQRDRRAFSLTELLIVIAIFAILLALLQPSLMKALDQTRNLHCRKNLAGLAMWGIIYSEDYGGLLPINDDQGVGSYKRPGGMGWYKKYPNWSLPQVQISQSTLTCPQALVALQPRTLLVARRGFDYGLNYFLGGRMASNSPEEPSIRYLTSKKYWWADGHPQSTSNGWFIWEYMSSSAKPWMWTTTSLFGYGHPNNSANYVFGDGHVESKLREEVTSLTGDDHKYFHGTATE